MRTRKYRGSKREGVDGVLLNRDHLALGDDGKPTSKDNIMVGRTAGLNSKFVQWDTYSYSDTKNPKRIRRWGKRNATYCSSCRGVIKYTLLNRTVKTIGYIRNNQGQAICNDCHNSIGISNLTDHHVVHNYHCSCSHCDSLLDNFTPISGTKYLGVELELNKFSGGVSQFIKRGVCTVQSDGSVRGAEIITKPMKIEEHREFWRGIDFTGYAASFVTDSKKKLSPLLSTFGDLHKNYTAYSTERTDHGMHVHVSRDYMDRESWCNLMVWYMCLHVVEISHIMGRDPSRYCTLPNRTNIDLDNNWDTYGDDLYYECSEARYLMFIGEDKPTVEFRHPRSSIYKWVIMGRIELVDALAEYQKNIGFSRSVTWGDFMSWAENKGSKYKNMRRLNYARQQTK